MKVRTLLLFLPIFLAAHLSAYTKQTQDLLSHADVKQVMEQLFEYHIDRKEIEEELLARSLTIYLKQFDGTKSYLLHNEVLPYIQPTPHLLKKMLRDYENNTFSVHLALDQKIQEGIRRARLWRKGWEKTPQQLMTEAKTCKLEKKKADAYQHSLTDLQERHRKKFVELIAVYIKEAKLIRPEDEEKVISLCEKQLHRMENEYLGLDEQDRVVSTPMQEHIVTQRLLKALAHSLDAHTAYYSPDEAYAMKVQLEKGMCGIGVVLKEGIKGITIHDMIAGGPAEKCGKLKSGDTIVEIDGESIEGTSFQKVLEIMKGQEGSTMVLGIDRYDISTPQRLRIELTRAKITLAESRVDVETEPYGDGYIGKLTLHSFYEGDKGISSERDLKKAIEQLKERGPLHGLVLDMRENSGGFLSQAVRVAGLFISSGVVVISKYADGSMKYYRTVDGMRHFDGPLVVLISRSSASAAEIVAQALKDYGVAVVVGDEQTYGKGTIQHQTITSGKGDSFFKVTIGRYYTVSGQSTQLEGVKADIFVPSPFNFEEIGESYLEYPLPADRVQHAYQDTLADIDPLSRRWFQKYYTPTIQKKEERWDKCLSVLRTNSAERLKGNKNFQAFLQNAKERTVSMEEKKFGVNDLQMEEAVNIVKDMLFLQAAPAS